MNYSSAMPDESTDYFTTDSALNGTDLIPENLPVIMLVRYVIL